MSLPDIDWSAPWLAPYRAVGQAVAVRAHLGIAAALNAAAPAPVQFVPQSALPRGEAYEHFIFQQRPKSFVSGDSWRREARSDR